jgi:xanthine dehydrogenase YagR molybdenum-binding subunit
VAESSWPAKVTGTARYTADVQLPRMLHAMVLRCPHAHARVKSVDVSAARNLPGVRAVRVVQDAGAEIRWALDEIAIAAAVSEQAARDAVRAIRVEYEVLPHWLAGEKIGEAPTVRPEAEETAGEPDDAMGAAAVRSRGFYALAVAAHDCPEPHAQVCEWNGETLTVWCSTEAVSGLGPQLAEALGIPATKVHVVCEHMGGGFGSKLAADPWTVECARIAKQAGAPVKLLLERDAERTVAGDRASLYAEVELGAAQDGRITAWRSRSWGSGGVGGAGKPPLPYVFQIPGRRHQHSSVATHRASARPWSTAPDHFQACFVTMAALEDLAARLGINPLDLVLLNLPLTGPLERVYREELAVADRLMGWRQRWHPRGDAGRGPVRRGLGLALHAWGGGGGVQMADVSVDIETGVVKVHKIVAVQDGTSESEVQGGLVLGISSALFEEKVLDPLTGRILNAGSYSVAAAADTGELLVHLMSGPGDDERGVPGLDIPPALSTGAALSNAVANAIGVRVPALPMTPERVLEALEKGRAAG